MNCAVIYYSKSGNTKNIADKIRMAFNADVFFVESEKADGSYLSAVIRVAGEKLMKKIPVLRQELRTFLIMISCLSAFRSGMARCPNSCRIISLILICRGSA